MADPIRLFLAGDVMTGRGIDQILPHPSGPALFESYVRDARDYVALAERANGPIEAPVDFGYVWGDALAVLERVAPDARIVNLETSITRHDEHWPGKGINYRMSPGNVACLTAAGLDCCGLANNHVVDWGFAGLTETLSTLRSAGIAPAGAGGNLRQAREPAVIDLGERGRVLVFACALETSGVPRTWAAGPGRAGVYLLPGGLRAAEAELGEAIASFRRPGDLVVCSIHWGGNWGYAIEAPDRALAQALVERAGVDVVLGHSSHHAKGVEIHRARPIIYGAGDFINDYEGISGRAAYRGDLRLAWFVELDGAGRGLLKLDVVPFQSRRLTLRMASDADVEWVRAVLARESAPLGVRVERWRHDTLRLEPSGTRR